MTDRSSLAKHSVGRLTLAVIPGPTADQIVAKVFANAQGGSIVLMHLGGYETLKALPRIVDGLRADGYVLVSLDELVDT